MRMTLGSAFAWVHAAIEDLPLPGPYPGGKQTAEVQAAMCSAGCIGAICNQAAESHVNHALETWVGPYQHAWGVRLRGKKLKDALGILPPKSAT